MMFPLIAYLGGVLTILSPCILPVLPFVFTRTGRPFQSGTLPMLLGLAVTFAGVAALATIGGGWAVRANQYGRDTALVLLGVFGLTLVFPALADLLSRPVLSLGNRLFRASGGPAGSANPAGSLLLGVATGLLWTPCAGPILGLLLTGAALQGAKVQTLLALLAYSAGAATALAMALLLGGQVLAALKRRLGAGEWARHGLGVAVLASVAAIALGLDTGWLARLSYAGTSTLEQAVLDGLSRPAPEKAAAEVAAKPAYRSDLPVEGRLPSLDGAALWLNSPPLAGEQLRGKVVLVNFWTYSCINCIRTLPYVRAWAEKYRAAGLVVIGVHAPEFAFERNPDNIKAAIGDFRIGYPVAVDNDFKIWRAFANRYWPAQYLIDGQGRIRYHHFGEGDQDRSERAIQDLLAEAGNPPVGRDVVAPEAAGAQLAPDLGNLHSAETYLGYRQAANFASPEGLKADVAQDYTAAGPGPGHWQLAGNWTVGGEQATLNGAAGNGDAGGIAIRFRARDLHLVLGPGAGGRPVRFRVTVDGKPPGADHGADIDADGNGVVAQTRLYQLVRQAGAVTERGFQVRFLDPGVEAFVFTFG